MQCLLCSCCSELGSAGASEAHGNAESRLTGIACLFSCVLQCPEPGRLRSHLTQKLNHTEQNWHVLVCGESLGQDKNSRYGPLNAISSQQD